jgi:hypothetical protein
VIDDSSELTILMRSAAMLRPGQTMPVDRDRLYAMCDELLSLRELVKRVGADLREIAAHAPRPPTGAGHSTQFEA